MNEQGKHARAFFHRPGLQCGPTGQAGAAPALGSSQAARRRLGRKQALPMRVEAALGASWEQQEGRLPGLRSLGAFTQAFIQNLFPEGIYVPVPVPGDAGDPDGNQLRAPLVISEITHGGSTGLNPPSTTSSNSSEQPHPPLHNSAAFRFMGDHQ